MAKQEIAFGLKIDGVEQTIKSVKDLKGAISAMQTEAENADIGSEQYKNAIENIEKLNDKLKEVTQTEKQAAKATEDLANAEKEAAKETGDLRKQFEVLEDELFMLAGQGKQNTAEFRSLTIEAANLNAKIDDVNQALSGGGVERAEGGFGKLQESLGKLDFKGVAKGAKMMGTALAATGVMLIVKMVGYLIENFDELSKGSGGLAVALRFVADIIGRIIATGQEMITFVTDLIGVTSESERAMEAQGEAMMKNAEKTKVALAEQVKGFDDQIAAAKAAGKSTVELEIAKQNAIIETNKQIALQVVEQIRLSGTVTDEQRKLAADSIANIKAAGQAKNLIIIADEKQKNDKIAELNKAAAEKRKAELEAQRAANLSMMQQIQDANIANEQNEEKRAIQKAYLDQQRRFEEINKTVADEILKDKLIAESKKTFFNEMAAIHQSSVDKQKAIDEKAAADSKALDDKFRAETNADNIAAAELNVIKNNNELTDLINQLTVKKEIDLQNENLTANEKLLIKEKYAQDVHKLETDAEKAKQDEIVKIIEQSLGSAQNLSDIFFLYKKNKAEKGSKEELDLARKQFNVNKALQLGFALMDSYKAITASIAQSPLAIGPVPNPAGIASLAFAITTSAANIAKIAATKFDGGGGSPSGGGASMPSPPSIPPPPTIATPENNTNKTTSFDETGKNLNFQGTPTPTINVKASVGVDEITSKSNRVEVLENQSTF